MKRVYLLRHAKSSWDEPSLADHDRPLAPRGMKAAGRIARYVEAVGLRPDIVLCSSAVRARETLARVLPAFGDDVEVHVEPGLYHAPAPALLERLRAVEEPVASVLLVGHNPGMHELVLLLAGRGAELARLDEGYPTGALATIALPTLEWRLVAPGSGELEALVVPRELR